MKDWHKTLVKESESVLRTISIIDSTEARLALVVSDSGQLLGTVTDGDIRRAILKGIKLEESLECVINRSPICSFFENDSDIFEALILKYKINQVPLVDNDKNLKGLYIANEMYGPKENSVVLMVGGLGSRLGELTENCPKPMLKIGGKPILDTIVKNFKSEGFEDFFFSVNFKSEVIEEYFGDGSDHEVKINYLRETKRMGTAGSLSALKGKVTNPIIVMNGDLLTSISFTELLKFHHESGAVATMCVREYDYQIPFGVVETDGISIKKISEKPTYKSFVNAGIYVVDPSALERIPDDAYFDMPSLFNKIIDSKQQATVFPIREYWLDIGRKEDFEKAHIEFRENFSVES